MNATASLCNAADTFMRESVAAKYSYNFTWLDRPIIQYPQDILAVQHIIWSVRPDLIIETGIAHGGSLVLSASLLALLDMSDAVTRAEMIDPRASRRRVLGVDLDIRAHNRAALDLHPMRTRIEMIEGSSISDATIAAVRSRASQFKTVMVFLDSNHTHDHVLAELEAYSPLVSPGSYCVVFDTIVEHMPKSMYPDRPWGPGNNPKTAVHQFLQKHSEFSVDLDLQSRLLITTAPGGYLRKTH